jgi:hypothetical protein
MPLMIAIACLATASCASTGSPDSSRTRPVRELAGAAAQAPGDLDKPCERPQRLPGRDLSAGDVERFWGRDRASLSACGDRHAANVRWRRARDAGLAGGVAQ